MGGRGGGRPPHVNASDERKKKTRLETFGDRSCTGPELFENCRAWIWKLPPRLLPSWLLCVRVIRLSVAADIAFRQSVGVLWLIHDFIVAC